MSEQNKALARRFGEDVFNKNNLALIPQIVAPTFVSHQPGGQDMRGLESVKQSTTMYRMAFPDLKITIEAQVTEGDLVASRWRATGTHKGDLMGIAPTGRKVSITGITIDRVAGGKLVEEWESFDQMGMMQQLGVIPAPGQAK